MFHIFTELPYRQVYAIQTEVSYFMKSGQLKRFCHEAPAKCVILCSYFVVKWMQGIKKMLIINQISAQKCGELMFLHCDYESNMLIEL